MQLPMCYSRPELMKAVTIDKVGYTTCFVLHCCSRGMIFKGDVENYEGPKRDVFKTIFKFEARERQREREKIMLIV